MQILLSLKYKQLLECLLHQENTDIKKKLYKKLLEYKKNLDLNKHMFILLIK